MSPSKISRFALPSLLTLTSRASMAPLAVGLALIAGAGCRAGQGDGGVPTPPAEAIEELPNDTLRDGHRVRPGHIIDGDTLDVLLGEDEHKVRLLGMNAPECRKSSRTVDGRRRNACTEDDELWGMASYELLVSLVEGREATVRCDVGRPGDPCPTDRYRRTLAYLEFDDVGDVGLRLIEEGAAMPFTRFDAGRLGRYCQAERAAQAAGRGMWAGRTVEQVLAGMSDNTRQWYADHHSRCDEAMRGL